MGKAVNDLVYLAKELLSRYNGDESVKDYAGGQGGSRMTRAINSWISGFITASRSLDEGKIVLVPQFPTTSRRPWGDWLVTLKVVNPKPERSAFNTQGENYMSDDCYCLFTVFYYFSLVLDQNRIVLILYLRCNTQ